MKAAFQGSYADLKFIKSRSVAQIVVELPIEEAAAFVAAFGAPVPGSECPVALARIHPEKAASAAAPMPAIDAPKERKPFNEWPLPQQAGYLCTIPAFERFLREGYSIEPYETVANFVKRYCDVPSRADITPDNKSGNRWLLLVSAYDTWRTKVAHVEA